MVFKKSPPNGLNFKTPVLASLLLHGILLGLLIFGLPGDVERPAGYGESQIISVSIVTGIADRASVQKMPGTFPQKGSSPPKDTGHLLGGEGGTSTILQQIRNKIERGKYYPLFAKRSKIEGSPLIEFKIKQDGSLEYVRLKKSSGHPILDESAAATVRQAVPYPFYPESIALNIHYTLAR